MKRNIKWFLYERLKRLNYVKTELNRLVGKSLFSNTCNFEKNSITSIRHSYYKKYKYNSISVFRLYCFYSISPKLVNKRYRMSRFALNFFSKNSKIPGIVKRGW